MEITATTSSPEPVYEQIVRQIQDRVASGGLTPGTALPPVRQLAGDLQLNRNTVARAYKQLEDRGVILTAGRKARFVRDNASREVERIKSSRAERSVRHLVAGVARRGLEPRRHRSLVHRRVARRATEGNDAMSEWIDFGLYTVQVVLLWVLLPRKGAQFTAAMIVDRDADWPAKHPGVMQSLLRSRWVLNTFYVYAALSIAVLSALRLGVQVPVFSRAADAPSWEVLKDAHGTLMILGMIMYFASFAAWTRWLSVHVPSRRGAARR